MGIKGSVNASSRHHHYMVRGTIRHQNQSIYQSKEDKTFLMQTDYC